MRAAFLCVHMVNGDLKCIRWTSYAGEHYFHFTLAHIEHFTMSLAVINIKDYLEPYSRTPSRVPSLKTIWTHISDANRKLGAKGHGVSLALSFPHAPYINTGPINFVISPSDVRNARQEAVTMMVTRGGKGDNCLLSPRRIRLGKKFNGSRVKHETHWNGFPIVPDEALNFNFQMKKPDKWWHRDVMVVTSCPSARHLVSIEIVIKFPNTHHETLVNWTQMSRSLLNIGFR